MLVVDAHAHIVPAHFPALASRPGRGAPGWPSLEPLGDGRGRMMIDGREFRTLDRAYFDLDARLALMDRERIDVQIVSPLPELLGYWLQADVAIELARLTHAAAAQACAAAPGRIAALGMLPLQDIDAAVAMVAEVAAAGLCGVQVGSNVNGRSIADPVYDPVWTEITRHNLAVWVHGIRPAGTERLLGPALMVNVIGIPQDTASAIASFITTDVLARHPSLKLGFAHGGGSFGALLDRMDFVWREYPAMRKTSHLSPRETMRRFCFDTVTYSVPYLRYLIDAFGAETLLCGTDGPTPGTRYECEATVLEACAGDRRMAAQLLSGNAARFFGLSLKAA